MNESHEHYSMNIQWSDEDDAYLVTVPELPGCVTHGSSYEEAAAQGRHAIDGWLASQREMGWPIPPPRVLVASA